MQQSIAFTINGERRSVTTDPDRPLLDVLREDLNLTGAKFGCGERQCGGVYGARRWPAGVLLHDARRVGRRSED